MLPSSTSPPLLNQKFWRPAALLITSCPATWRRPWADDRINPTSVASESIVVSTELSSASGPPSAILSLNLDSDLVILNLEPPFPNSFEPIFEPPKIFEPDLPTAIDTFFKSGFRFLRMRALLLISEG